jgi:hypothetical protein
VIFCFIAVMGRRVWGKGLSGWATAACALACAVAAPARAEEADRLTITGAARVRYEGLTGQARAGLSRNADLYTTRLNLAAGYDLGGGVRLGAELQDARGYGGKVRGGLSANDVDTFELVQAYVAARVPTPVGPGVVQAGRFVVPMLGSRRLISAGDDRNAANGFTGVRLDARAANGVATSLIAVAPQRRLPDAADAVAHNRWGMDQESLHTRLWGGSVEAPAVVAGAAAAVTFLGLDEEDTPARATRDRRLRTIDARLFHAGGPGGINFEAEGAYQFGHASETVLATAPRRGVSAWFLHLEAGYPLSETSKMRVGGLFDVASGDHGGGRYNRFDTLYGMRRGDFGPGGLYQSLGRANLISPGLRLDAEPGLRSELMVSYRGLWLASKTDAFSTTGVRDLTGRSGRFAGQQVNARVSSWLLPERLRLEVDGLILFKGRFWRAAPNAPSRADTKYLSVAVTANF